MCGCGLTHWPGVGVEGVVICRFNSKLAFYENIKIVTI